MWSKYDISDEGFLDKIESMNFLNEIMSLNGYPEPNLQQINILFRNLDSDSISQEQFTALIETYLYKLKGGTGEIKS